MCKSRFPIKSHFMYRVTQKISNTLWATSRFFLKKSNLTLLYCIKRNEIHLHYQVCKSRFPIKKHFMGRVTQKISNRLWAMSRSGWKCNLSRVSCYMFFPIAINFNTFVILIQCKDNIVGLFTINRAYCLLLDIIIGRSFLITSYKVEKYS